MIVDRRLRFPFVPQREFIQTAEAKQDSEFVIRKPSIGLQISEPNDESKIPPIEKVLLKRNKRRRAPLQEATPLSHRKLLIFFLHHYALKKP
jgi:hypothetical protein